MPIVERIGLEPMQPTYFYGRNQTIPHFLHTSAYVLLFLTKSSISFLENLRFLINNVIISVPCETRTHAPQIKNLML